MKKNIFSYVLTTSVAILSTSQIAAQSIDFDSLLRTYLGGVGDKNGLTQVVIKNNLQTRQDQLEQQIKAGIASGQITPQEDAELRASLSQFTLTKAQFLADGTLSDGEVQMLLDQLMQISNHIQAYLTNSTTVGSATADHRAWFRQQGQKGNDATRRARIDSLQAEISTTIDQGISYGWLNWNNASRYRTDLQRIADTKNRYLADGRLDFKEQQNLVNDLSALKDRLDSEMNSRNRFDRGGGRQVSNNVNSQQSFLRQRITAGISSGKLSRAEGDRLLREEQKISDLETRLRASGNTLTFAEQKRLFDEQDNLSKKINEALYGRPIR